MFMYITESATQTRTSYLSDLCRPVVSVGSRLRAIRLSRRPHRHQLNCYELRRQFIIWCSGPQSLEPVAVTTVTCSCDPVGQLRCSRIRFYVFFSKSKNVTFYVFLWSVMSKKRKNVESLIQVSCTQIRLLFLSKNGPLFWFLTWVLLIYILLSHYE